MISLAFQWLDGIVSMKMQTIVLQNSDSVLLSKKAVSEQISSLPHSAGTAQPILISTVEQTTKHSGKRRFLHRAQSICFDLWTFKCPDSVSNYKIEIWTLQGTMRARYHLCNTNGRSVPAVSHLRPSCCSSSRSYPIIWGVTVSAPHTS